MGSLKAGRRPSFWDPPSVGSATRLSWVRGMSRPSASDANFKSAAARAARLFKKASPLLERSRFLLFVCGGADTSPPKLPTMRQRFLSKGPTLLPNGIFLLAEKVAEDLARNGQPQFLDLSDFERVLVEIADVVVLFSESPGSIAELGYFVAHNAILPKLLVVLDNAHFNGESFINNGLVSKINKKSLFQPAASVDFSDPDPDFDFVKDRITRRIPHVLRRKSLPISQFSALNFHDRFVFVHWLVHVTGSATAGQIAHCIKKFCGDESVEFEDVLSALAATGLISRDKDNPDRVSYETNISSFLVFNSNATEDIRAIFVEAEQKGISDAA